MDQNSFLVWWLLAVPVILAIVDRFMIGGGKTAGAGTADGYISRQSTQMPSMSNASNLRPT